MNVPKQPNLVPNSPKPFARRGIRLHDPAAGSIGALTNKQQMTQASQVAQLTDPVTGGELPQDRVERYEGGQ